MFLAQMSTSQAQMQGQLSQHKCSEPSSVNVLLLTSAYSHISGLLYLEPSGSDPARELLNRARMLREEKAVSEVHSGGMLPAWPSVG